MTLDGEFKVEIQHSMHFSEATHSVIVSELICHIHLNKCQYTSVQSHTSVTPPYLPIHICNLATNQQLAARQHELTTFIALYFCVRTLCMALSCM